MVFAESSGANPYAAQNAAVSASAGSHGNSSYSPATGEGGLQGGAIGIVSEVSGHGRER